MCWDALAEIGATDVYGNTITGDAVLINSRNVHVHADGITVATARIDDLTIVANGLHVIIVPRGRSHEVKKMVEVLKARELS